MNKKGFTLVELSVVIVIISIMLSVVLVSRSLIDGARINKIYEDYRNLDRSVKLFYDQYDCLPGDCTAKQIPNFSNNISAVCLTDNIVDSASNIKLGTGAIESTVKRACMMHSLHLSGMIDGLDPTYNSATNLLETVSGKTVPFAKFSNRASWNFRKITSGHYSNVGIRSFFPGIFTGNRHAISLPIEISNHGGPRDQYLASFSSSTTYHEWILHSSNTIIGSSDPLVYDSIDNDVPQSRIKPAISARLAGKLDMKFDDGLPYRGVIFGGKIWSNGWNENFCNTANSSPTSVSQAQGPTATYINSNSLEKGCLAVFIGNYNFN
jgi:prepilin-type N-terminal cleavage/methylation domain-containing protein